MAQIVLKQEIVDIIKDQPLLFAKVAIALDVKSRTLSDILADNPPRLTTAGVLKALREHTGITEDTELLTELSEEIMGQ